MAKKLATNGKADKAAEARKAAVIQLRAQAATLAEQQQVTLISLLRDTESLSRQAALAEVEIGHQRGVQERLRAELDVLVTKGKSLATEATTLSQQKVELEKVAAEREKDVREARKSLDGLGKTVAGLEKEAASLTREREGLEQKRVRLEEDLVRLRKVRDEYMAGIARFRALREEMVQ